MDKLYVFSFNLEKGKLKQNAYDIYETDKLYKLKNNKDWIDGVYLNQFSKKDLPKLFDRSSNELFYATIDPDDKKAKKAFIEYYTKKASKCKYEYKKAVEKVNRSKEVLHG